MRFNFLIFFILCSRLFSQSTVFIKYTSDKSISELQSQISLILSENGSENNSSFNEENVIVSSLKNDFGNLNAELNRIIRLRIPANIPIEKLTSQLKLDSQVEYVQKASTLKLDLIPVDSLYSEQWGIQSVNAQNTWELIENTDDIILAVIDTGIDYLHPDIDDNIFYNEGERGIDSFGNDKSYNGIDDDKNGFIDDYQGWDFVNKLDIFPLETDYDFSDWDNDPMDEHGHGTNISGIIAAEHNSFGIAGLLPNVKILNLRSFDKNGEGQEDDAASAIIYAVKMGVKVINMSWGDNQYSQLLKDVVEYAYENGVVMVGSSGNTSSNEPHYPSSFSEVISVGAIQENELLAGFSNYGSTIDLVAPGSQIYTLGLNNTYKKVSGTSASAPFVSAAASIIISQKSFSNEEVKQILKTTAKDLGENGWDDKYGAGNLNMFKAVKLLSPSEIKFNYPTQDLYFADDKFDVNLTCLSPYFQDYKLFYGVGTNPIDWNQLPIENDKYQVFEQNVYQIDLSEFEDTSYTLRLLVNRIDGNTLEERVNFSVDRTPPEVLNYNYFPAMLNDKEILQASVLTNEPTKVKLFYRKRNSNEDFKFVYLDGFNGDIGTISQSHYGIIPLDEQISGFNHEFYFEAINQAGLTKTIKDIDQNFFAKNVLLNRIITNYPQVYSLPLGRIFHERVFLNGIDESFLFINENETSADLSIYQLFNSDFEKVNYLEKRIPVSVGDFNNDGKTDILSLFVKNGFIDSQVAPGSTSFENVFSDSSESFWPSLAEDIDDDDKYEIIVFSSDTSITIWEVGNNFNLRKESELTNFVQSTAPNKSIFRNNSVIVDNFDDDPEKEIITFDNYSRAVIFQINGNDNYTNDRVIEHFYPIESKSTFAKGDYNGDGRADIAVLMEFEENVFETPLVYCSIFSINGNDIDLHFQNMFISAEKNFISNFDKTYKSLSLADIDNNNKDDLIIFNFPNSYIFEYNENPQLLFYQNDVNSQSIFTGDIDQNGVLEIGIPRGNKLLFQEFREDERISPPVITDSYALDSNRIYIEWNNNDYPVFISRIGINGSIGKPRFISSSEKSFIDSVEPNSYYDYLLEYHDRSDSSIISAWSNIVNVYSHAPGIFDSISVVKSGQILISFTQPVEKNKIKLSNFLIDNYLPSSVSVASENDYLISFSEKLSVGDHQLKINNLRDFYNSPIKDTTLTFEITESSIEEKLFISNYEILDNFNLSITFNFSLDSISIVNKNNYMFSPSNILERIIFSNSSPETVILTAQKPFGSIGREYVLKLGNILSSAETGYIPIAVGSGSEIVLTSNAENLDEIYVYPNPVNVNSSESLTFANLTSKAHIYIYTIDGIFVKKVIEDDGNGGVDWNLTDTSNLKVSSGVYFYKAIAYDNFDNKLQEKIGKFAVIK